MTRKLLTSSDSWMREQMAACLHRFTSFLPCSIQYTTLDIIFTALHGACVCNSLLPTDDRIELLWIQLTFRGRKVVIGALYHPPRPLYKEAELIDELERVTERILAEHDDILVILAGDFNQLSRNVLVQLGYVYVFHGATHVGHSGQFCVTLLCFYVTVSPQRHNKGPFAFGLPFSIVPCLLLKSVTWSNISFLRGVPV